ncbi:hypothetical protein V7114_06735 [Neobacillus niacini]|uniref:hypothetical protein n=1 Tax=Neobacillus niacini TaxID=86668 RepID=UPI003000CC68
MNNGVCMRVTKTGEIVQLQDNLSFGDAFSKVTELRSKQDGNWYWIGKAINHKLMN